MSDRPTEQFIHGGEAPSPLSDAASAPAATPPLTGVSPDDEIEPPIVRHDPFAYMRAAKWMNRTLSPQGRAARRLEAELEAFPVLEGREPNTADIDAMAKRVVDYMVPIFRREQLTDMAYEILDEKRQARIAARRKELQLASHDPTDTITAQSPSFDGSHGPYGKVDPYVVLASNPPRGEASVEVAQATSVDQPAASPTDVPPREGKPVVLPGGERVKSDEADSTTGYLMSPYEDLSHVAEAGREARRKAIRRGLDTWNYKETQNYARALAREQIGQGGDLDYQRYLPRDGISDFEQRRHFRDVANFNVGLFMQQAGVGLKETLEAAGAYAEDNSSNHRPGERHGLDPRTRRWIERGWRVGASKIFDPPSENDPGLPSP